MFPVQLPEGLHKYLAAVVLRLGRGFSISALINQMLPKYLETYAKLDENARRDLAARALDLFKKPDPVPYDHRMPLHIADSIRETIPACENKDVFARTLDQMILLAGLDFRENGPLKGKEF